jgi:hypothetical protein
MDRETLNSLDKETLIRLILSQAEAIERLTREVEALRADNAELRGKLNLPQKTPENSSAPPSQGHKSRASRISCSRESGVNRTPGRIARYIPIRPRSAMSSPAAAIATLCSQ